LTATAISDAQINLSWTDNANNEDGFRIERCAGSGCATFAEIGTVSANVTTYQDADPTDGTSYSYRVRAYNVAGNSAYSNTASATTAVGAPTGLTATAVSSSQINLSWTDNATSETGFRIERCGGSGCSTFVEIATVGANVTSYQNTGLTANMTYRYQVRAYNAAGNSGYSNIAGATTATAPPGTPTALTATGISDTQINLSWADNANNEDGFRIEQCSGTGCTTFTEIATVGPNVTTYQNTGLSASTTYRYQVRAYNVTGNSNYSNIASATTTPAPPGAPSGLTATTISSTQINLSWTDNATNEDGFRIERCTGAGCTTFVEIATVGVNATTYQNTTGLSASTTYSYQVRAYNGGGNSGYSNTASATTAPTLPSAPSGLGATVISSTQINLSWTDNATNEDGFRIERCSGSGCTTFAEIATVSANVTSYQSTGLTAATTYRYQVRAYNVTGNSNYSNIVSATTLPNPPAAPTALVVTSVTSNKINLSWTDNANNEDGFQIERCTGAGCTNFLLIMTISTPNTTAFSNTGLPGSTTYRYQVRAYNTGGASAPSNAVTGTTT
jgi:hypothetical protein